MAHTANVEKMARTARQMAEAQRDSYEALAGAFTGLQRRNAGLLSDGAEFLRLQEQNTRLAQEWLAGGVRVLEGQQRTADFAQGWLTSGIDAMREQTEQNLRAAEALAENARTQQEGFRYFAGEWARAYRTFFSPFAYAQEGLRASQRAAETATRQGIEATQQTVEVAQQAVGQGLRLADEAAAQTDEVLRKTVEATREAELQTAVLGALGGEDYERLTVADVSKKLDGLSAEQLAHVREYERRNKNRESLLEQIDRKIKAAS